MKKITFCLMAACLSLTFHPLQSNAENTPSNLVVSNLSASQEEVNTLVVRLNEINDMDKSNLKFSDKRNLRREVRSIKQKLSETHDGVYISVGALIIILLLLIILF